MPSVHTYRSANSAHTPSRSLARRILRRLIVAATAGLFGIPAISQVVTLVPSVTKYAGTGAGFYNGDFGAANFIALNNPIALAIDSSGAIYVADTGNNCVRRLDSNTQFTTVVGLASVSGGDTCNAASNPTPTAAQGLLTPYGIAFDALDNLYIADNGHNCVRMLPAHTAGVANLTTVAGTCTAPNPNSTTTTAGSSTPRPAGIKVDSQSRLFITLRDAPDSIHQVLRHVLSAPTSDLCLISGAAGANVSTPCAGYPIGPTLNQPADITFDPLGNLYIADTGNNCVRVIKGTATSTAVGTCTNDNSASGSAGITSPLGVLFDRRGELYISESNVHQLVRFNPGSLSIMRIAGSPSGAAGPYTTQQNGAGSQSIPLSTPAGMALDANGNIFLADSGNSILRRFQSPSSFGSVAIGSQSSSQSLSFSINQNATLSAATGPDYLVTANTCLGPVVAAPAGQLSNYCTVTVSFSPSLPGRRYSPLTIKDTISGSTVSVGLQGISLSSQPVFAPGKITTQSTGTALRSTAVNSAGDLYVLDAGAGPNTATVKRYPAGGGAPVTVVAAGSGALVAPVSIRLDAAQNLYVLDNSTGKLTEFAASGAAPLAVISGLTSPTAFDIDANGNFFIAEGGVKHDLVKYFPGGEGLVIAGAGAILDPNNVPGNQAGLIAPSGVLVSNGGDIYVSDAAQRRVYVVDTAGLIHRVAGNGLAADTSAGDSLGTALLSPSELAIDAAGDVFISDPAANKVFVLYAATTQSNNIAVLAGTGTAGSSGNNGSPTAATLSAPRSLSAASSGEIFILDSGNNAVRLITFPAPTVDFGTVPLNGFTTRTATLWNRGNIDFLRTSDPAISDPAFKNYPTLTTCGPQVGVGTTCDFGFSFQPTTTGTHTTDATLSNPAYNAPQIVHLTGQVGATSITTFTAPAETEVYGGVYTGTLTVATNGGTTPTGTVTFSVGATTICSVTGNVTGTITCTKSPSSGLTPGTYTVTVAYSGDTNYPAQSTTTTLTVSKATITVVVANKTKNVGDPVPTLTGTVTGIVTGDNVTVSYSTTATTFSVPGVYPINATVTFTPTTLSDRYNVVITPGTLTENSPTVLTVSSSANPAGIGQSITLTATLTPSTSPGSVTFKDGSTTLCNAVAVSGGTAQCVVPSLTLGTHTITVTYTSSNGFFLSANATFTQFVTVPSGSITVSISPVSQYIIGPGSMTFPVTVTAIGGFSGPVKLTCSGLPSDATCDIANSTVTLSTNGSATTTLTTTTSDTDAALRLPALPWHPDTTPLYAATLFPMGLSGLGAIVAGLRRRKSLARLLMVLFVVLGTIGLSGCGCPVSSYKSYQVTVTASSVNGGPPNATATTALYVAKKGN